MHVCIVITLASVQRLDAATARSLTSLALTCKHPDSYRFCSDAPTYIAFPVHIRYPGPAIPTHSSSNAPASSTLVSYTLLSTSLAFSCIL
ncbi:uncharacterized protein C8Q71DRAFT_54882 [Rhodofomes roseus]|uniref:Secreted protein n=1 Tax=Rhodofomes roseus TaxID=34475 RepID=A0ABQ8KFZ8_9APHY|nr:uncharacterized protein C8Q71DRAFT_54882 [Rhodofomes roseus]KAH9836698.1 hypothetical protein C8Q71DRAFT_54882 [Rhodofomes roseus]